MLITPMITLITFSGQCLADLASRGGGRRWGWKWCWGIDYFEIKNAWIGTYYLYFDCRMVLFALQKTVIFLWILCERSLLCSVYIFCQICPFYMLSSVGKRMTFFFCVYASRIWDLQDAESTDKTKVIQSLATNCWKLKVRIIIYPACPPTFTSQLNNYITTICPCCQHKAIRLYNNSSFIGRSWIIKHVLEEAAQLHTLPQFELRLTEGILRKARNQLPPVTQRVWVS